MFLYWFYFQFFYAPVHMFTVNNRACSWMIVVILIYQISFSL